MQLNVFHNAGCCTHSSILFTTKGLLVVTFLLLIQLFVLDQSVDTFLVKLKSIWGVCSCVFLLNEFIFLLGRKLFEKTSCDLGAGRP